MFRKASIGDCLQIYGLICDLESRELPFDRFKRIYSDQLSNEHYYCLVNDQNGHVNAVLNMRFEEQLHHAEHVAEIMEFAVENIFRKQGVGKAMLRQACLIAEEYGCSQIEVACNQLRENTHRFYLREGMQNSHFKFSKSFKANGAIECTISK